MENREPEYLVSEKVSTELKRIFNDLHKIYLPIQLCGPVMALGLLIEKIDHDTDLFEYYATHILLFAQGNSCFDNFRHSVSPG